MPARASPRARVGNWAEADDVVGDTEVRDLEHGGESGAEEPGELQDASSLLPCSYRVVMLHDGKGCKRAEIAAKLEEEEMANRGSMLGCRQRRRQGCRQGRSKASGYIGNELGAYDRSVLLHDPGGIATRPGGIATRPGK